MALMNNRFSLIAWHEFYFCYSFLPADLCSVLVSEAELPSLLCRLTTLTLVEQRCPLLDSCKTAHEWQIDSLNESIYNWWIWIRGHVPVTSLQCSKSFYTIHTHGVLSGSLWTNEVRNGQSVPFFHLHANESHPLYISVTINKVSVIHGHKWLKNKSLLWLI